MTTTNDLTQARRWVDDYTKATGGARDYIALQLASCAPALLAKVDELTAALRDSADMASELSRAWDALNRAGFQSPTAGIAELIDQMAAALAERDAQLTAANRRNDGLQADLDSATKANTAWANENAELRTALLDVAKTGGVTHVWDRQSTDWVPVAKFAATKAEVAR